MYASWDLHRKKETREQFNLQSIPFGERNEDGCEKLDVACGICHHFRGQPQLFMLLHRYPHSPVSHLELLFLFFRHKLFCICPWQQLLN